MSCTVGGENRIKYRTEGMNRVIIPKTREKVGSLQFTKPSSIRQEEKLDPGGLSSTPTFEGEGEGLEETRSKKY